MSEQSKNEESKSEESVNNPVFTTFAQVQEALDNFCDKHVPPVPIAQARHHRFWRKGETPDEQYQFFVTGSAIPGFPIITPNNGATSNIILALSGQAPFDGSELPQMPPVPPNTVLDPAIVQAISDWITRGAKQYG